MRDRPLLIVDCDPGHDDALALVLADAYATVLGITSVSGNAPLDDTTRNALGIAALLGSCLLYTSPSPRDGLLSRMPSSA